MNNTFTTRLALLVLMFSTAFGCGLVAPEPTPEKPPEVRKINKELCEEARWLACGEECEDRTPLKRKNACQATCIQRPLGYWFGKLKECTA